MTDWITIEQADAYFAGRLGAESHWTDGTDKAAALATAQRQLAASGQFCFPDEPDGAMGMAVCEQALFLLIHGEGVDRRQGLQAQGVRAAALVGETYGAAPAELPISPMAQAFLAPYDQRRHFRMAHRRRRNG